MTDFLITMITLYPWFTWLLVIFAAIGIGYGSLWLAGMIMFVSGWMSYRRAVWASKSRVRRRLREDGLFDCPTCAGVAADLAEDPDFLRGDDPPEYQHPDGPGDWDEPGEDWSPAAEYGQGAMAGVTEILRRAHEAGLLDDDQLPDGPPAEPAESSDPWGRPWCYEDDHGLPGHAPHERHAHIPGSVSGAVISGAVMFPPAERTGPPLCDDPECDKYGWVHPPPCLTLPTMPVPQYTGPAMPAGPPVPWSGLAASLETLHRGDGDKPLHPAIQADLKAAGFSEHPTIEGALDSTFTRAQAREVEAMITDGVIPAEPER